ncbi:MAG: hypothetical protein P4L33_04815 [Capsulimonadaceae bacterium]|nr:hypothetical protein [Capsulimonadaceae bacterium]
MASPTNKLLVEGVDDLHVCKALLEHHRVPETFVVTPKNGIEALIEGLDVELDASGLTRLGVIVDADTDLAARWTQLTAKLKAYGYKTVPAQPDASGTVVDEDGLPRLGAWLMPNNSTTGMLEHFVEQLVPQDDNLWQDAQAVVAGLGDRQRFPSQHVKKAQIHTWLAWQKEPGRPLGTAITARYLDANSAQAASFIAWITRLFVD